MIIALPHRDGLCPDHLEEVIEQMRASGPPKIRAIWNNSRGIWMAIEGCHRIRAAKALGISPIIVDVSDRDTIKLQLDGIKTRKRVAWLASVMSENIAYGNTTIISFED